MYVNAYATKSTPSNTPTLHIHKHPPTYTPHNTPHTSHITMQVLHDLHIQLRQGASLASLIHAIGGQRLWTGGPMQGLTMLHTHPHVAGSLLVLPAGERGGPAVYSVEDPVHVEYVVQCAVCAVCFVFVLCVV